MSRPSVQPTAGPRAFACAAIVASSLACRAPLPSPPAPEDPDLAYPPACAAKGMALCEHACDDDRDPGACLWVAESLALPGPRHDAELARALVTRACGRGFLRACAQLGVALASTDAKQSRAHLERACAGGYGRACVTYAALHVLALSPLDWKAAAPWLERGCKADDALACVAFADLLRAGVGVEADPQRARETHHRACELGRSSACDEEAAGTTKQHAIHAPDPPVDALAPHAKGVTNVRVDFCVAPDGAVEVRSVAPPQGELAALCRRVVATWRFTPSGRTSPACSEVVFAIAVDRG
jgi:hypothetical protein